MIIKKSNESLKVIQNDTDIIFDNIVDFSSKNSCYAISAINDENQQLYFDCLEGIIIPLNVSIIYLVHDIKIINLDQIKDTCEIVYYNNSKCKNLKIIENLGNHYLVCDDK